MALAALSLPLGACLDAVFGDPRGWPHPVRGIGWHIAVLERSLRRLVGVRGGGRRAQRVAGVALATAVVSTTALVAWSIVLACDWAGAVPSLIGRTVLIYWGLAIRSLGDETLRASEAIDLDTARRELAMIVGRDTAALNEPEIHRACIETVAENFNDAVVAPLFWFVIGGPVALWAFKASSTLDSMVGYRDDRFRDLGWASARLDDVAAFIPARLSWLLIAVSALVVGERPWPAIAVGWRDGRKHPSPNAAWSEAAMAGALGVSLGGAATYAGVITIKPRLGDGFEPIGRGTVRRALRLMWVASGMAVALAWGVRVVILGLA